MKKPNITPTPWMVDPKAKLRITSNENTVCSTSVGQSGDKLEIEQENAQAIVTAVNCTYGANINPEKIQELIEASEDYVRETDYEKKKLSEIKLRRALNSIKYK